MLDFQIISLVFVLVLLSLNTISDIRKREVMFSDKIWFVLGIVGFLLFLISNYDELLVQFAFMAVSLTLVLIFWRLHILSSGDIIISLIICVTLPNNFIPIVTMITSLILSGIVHVTMNIVMNVQTKLRNEKLFENFDNSIIIKIISFFIVHKKRNYEKYSISVENGKKINIFINPETSDFEAKNGAIVSYALPLVPFILISLLLTFVMLPYYVYFIINIISSILIISLVQS